MVTDSINGLATVSNLINAGLPATLGQFPVLAIVSRDILDSFSQNTPIVSQDLLATLSRFPVLITVIRDILDAAVSQHAATVSQGLLATVSQHSLLAYFSRGSLTIASRFSNVLAIKIYR